MTGNTVRTGRFNALLQLYVFVCVQTRGPEEAEIPLKHQLLQIIVRVLQYRMLLTGNSRNRENAKCSLLNIYVFGKHFKVGIGMKITAISNRRCHKVDHCDLDFVLMQCFVSRVSLLQTI